CGCWTISIRSRRSSARLGQVPTQPTQLSPSFVNDNCDGPRRNPKRRLSRVIASLGIAAICRREISSTFAPDFLRSPLNGFPQNRVGNALGALALRILCKV